MAKFNMTVDNDLDEVKLESNKIDSKKDKKVKNVDKKEKKENKNGKDNFFTLVRKEMKLVTWPTRKNVVKYSIVTILMIILLALFFIGISALFSLLYNLVQGWIG